MRRGRVNQHFANFLPTRFKSFSQKLCLRIVMGFLSYLLFVPSKQDDAHTVNVTGETRGPIRNSPIFML